MYFFPSSSRHPSHPRMAFVTLTLCLAVWLSPAIPLRAQTLDVLVFSRTTGFRHSSISEGIAAIEQLGAQYDFSVTATEDPAIFSDASLASFDVAIFLQSTEGSTPLLSSPQQSAFESFIQAGNGFVGVHAASDVTNNWPWYIDLLGAQFARHPSRQSADVTVELATDVSTAHLDPVWNRFDEWYDFQQVSPDIEVLLQLDESTYNGGQMGTFHPISWKQEFEGGRSWYTGMGHVEAAYIDPDFLQHMAGGILWAGGLDGDLDNSGTTNLADYTTWRDGLGDQFTSGDYEVWKAFASVGSQTGEAAVGANVVPEPGALLLLTMAIAASLATSTVARP